ncbi:MAG: SusD/RagB family nutrient-binding outer membrane lipoprotein [Bacteroidales bacterium]|nr:SusD/RagB family nutrient-binding outer membrane lipoprotein [Bacteroidales bacterium]
MKNIIKIFSAAVLLSVLGGCTKNFEDYNTDPKAIRKDDPSIIIPSMFDPLMYIQQNNSQFVDMMVGTLGGYFADGSRWGNQNYDTFNVSDDWNRHTYDKAFTAIYSNYFKVEKITKGEGHYYAIAKLLKAAAMIRVTDCYGPMPYSKVRDGEMRVEYDSHEDVYKNIIADLSDAARVLKAYVAEAPNSKPLALSDPVFAGDYGKWVKFANSLIMRVAMRTGDRDAFVDAYNAGEYIKTNSDNAMMDPKTQGNPYSIAQAWNGGELFVAASIIDYLTGYNDPRIEAYALKCTKDQHADKYIGLRRGYEKMPTDHKLYSRPNVVASTKIPMLVAAEVQFMIAEAVLNNWISGDAKTFYETGINLSFEQWGVPVGSYVTNADLIPADHNDPLDANSGYDRKTTVKIAWDAETSEAKHREQIATQRWIAGYPNGLEAWAEWRRTGYPELCPSVKSLNPNVIRDDQQSRAYGMRRLRYSFEEASLNTENYNKGVALLKGADNEATNLFWAKKSLPNYN